MKDIKPNDMNTILANTDIKADFTKGRYESTKDIDMGPAERYKNSDTLKLVPKFFKFINKQLHIYIPKGTRFYYKGKISWRPAEPADIYVFAIGDINIEFIPGRNIDKNIYEVFASDDELKTERANKIAQYLD